MADPDPLKKFFVVANLVRQHPVDELVAQLKSRKIISKEQVIRESKHASSRQYWGLALTYLLQ